MNKNSATLSSLALIVALLAGLLGTVHSASAHPARQAGDPVSIVMAMVEAFNNNDAAKLDELLDPTFVDTVSNPPSALAGLPTTENKQEFIASAKEGVHVTLSNCQLTAPDTVECDTVLAGGPLDALILRNPYTEKSTLTVTNGKITRLVETISAQTLDDLSYFIAASGGLSPGMPTTGSADAAFSIIALALGLLLLASGLLIRRAAVTSRQ